MTFTERVRAHRNFLQLFILKAAFEYLVVVLLVLSSLLEGMFLAQNNVTGSVCAHLVAKCVYWS
jgi:hypothetical protein